MLTAQSNSATQPGLKNNAAYQATLAELDGMVGEVIAAHATEAGLLDVDEDGNPVRSSSKGDLFSLGIDFMYAALMLVERMGQSVFEDMQKRADVANETQDLVTRMQALLYEYTSTDPANKKPLPEEVITFMRDNGINVDGKSIDDYLTSIDADTGTNANVHLMYIHMDPPPQEYIDFLRKNEIKVAGSMQVDEYLEARAAAQAAGEELPHVYANQVNTGQAELIKGCLSNFAKKKSDMVAQDNLQIQSIFALKQNVTGLCTSLQSSLKDLLDRITQKM
jgi:secreted effector protein SseB